MVGDEGSILAADWRGFQVLGVTEASWHVEVVHILQEQIWNKYQKHAAFDVYTSK